MKVKQLKKILNEYDDELDVMLVTKYQQSAHGGIERSTSYNEIVCSKEIYKNSIRISDNGYLDVETPYLEIKIGVECTSDIPEYVLSELNRNGEKIFNTKITLTKLYE